MSVTVLTLAQLRKNALAAIQARNPTRDTSPESTLGKLADALAGLLWDLHLRVQRTDYDAIPQAKSSYAALSLAAYTFGVSNGAGGYGPKGASAATGIVATATGTPASVIADGASVVFSDGSTLGAVVDGPEVIGAGGSVSVNIDAVTKGAAGNAAVGDHLSLVSPGTGVVADLVVTTGTSNGADLETPAALLGRILERLQNPPKAITGPDLRQAAEALAAAGVVRCFVYPRRGGTGTAHMVPLVAANTTPTSDVYGGGGGTGTERKPGAGALLLVQDDSDVRRNVGAEDITAMLPVTNAGVAIKVRVSPVPATASKNFDFDWDSNASARTVAAHSSGSITLNTAAPADFIAYLAAHPYNATTGSGGVRIQLVTAASVLPQIAIVTALSVGNTVCTLSRPLDTPVINGDSVYAGGPVVLPIALGILEYIASLGPSRVSGFADPLDAWDDTIRIDQLRRVALTATDPDDGATRMINELASAPLINGASTDKRAADNSIGFGPGLLLVASIAVLP